MKKIDQLKSFMDAGEWQKAIKFASKFPRLGEQKEVITRASSAMLAPAMYKQMGYDIDELIENAKQALISRYL